MNGVCCSVDIDGVLVLLAGGGNTITLYAVIKLI